MSALVQYKLLVDHLLSRRAAGDINDDEEEALGVALNGWRQQMTDSEQEQAEAYVRPWGRHEFTADGTYCHAGDPIQTCACSSCDSANGENMSKTLREQLIEFHTLVGQPVLTTPQVPDEKRVRLRAALIAEEFFEVMEAMFNVEEGPAEQDYPRRHFGQAKESIQWLIEHGEVAVNLPELADGLADLNYVIEGTHLEFGINGKPIADEVHANNMTKKSGPIGPNGKIQKPPGWKPPDIEGALRAQGWKP
jgi:predicted HAD superfamily Cof-like phosphohydrolase